MNGGSDPYKPYHFLKECNENIYVNWFSRLRLLAEVSVKLKKMHFFGQFKDHKQTTPFFFSSTFSALTVCNIHF